MTDSFKKCFVDKFSARRLVVFDLRVSLSNPSIDLVIG